MENELNFFNLITQSDKSLARTGTLKFSRGEVVTPVFMPIGTLGSIKSLTMDDMNRLGASIILGNTYHLWLQPGTDVIDNWGGLHNFNTWQKPILTDSGGFQAFSLAKIRKFTEKGVSFTVPKNGNKMFLSPEISMEIQTSLGSDIALCLDECLPAEVTHQEAKRAMERTHRWAKRSKEAFDKLKNNNEIHTRRLFGIPQGAQFIDLREASAKAIKDIGFDGYSIGGVANGGEPEEIMYQQVLAQTKILEPEKPRHLLGVGTPMDIVQMVGCGIDMFDCVYPTRNARHGSLFFWKNDLKTEYEIVQIKGLKFKMDKSAINSHSKFEELRQYSKGYLSHLFRCKELLAYRLATINNLEFYIDMVDVIRNHINAGSFESYRDSFKKVN